MLNAMRHAVMASNTLTFGQAESAHQPIQFSDALFLATRGGAALLDMEQDMGALEVGKLADLLLVDMKGEFSNQSLGYNHFLQ